MPAAYEGTDIISCLQSKYITRLAVYHIAAARYHFLQEPESIRKNAKNIFFVAHRQKPLKILGFSMVFLFALQEIPL